MKQHTFDIELIQPVIISQQAATVGAHQSLDYISGSALLGLVASKLYATLSKDEAFLLFHSGKVRFLDALPIEGQAMAYPVPMCLHTFKGEKYSDNNELHAKQIFDSSHPDCVKATEKQPVQLRNFYVTLSGQKINPKKEQTLKTALDAKQNRAAESQLFGYEALTAGQKFRFSVHADDDVAMSLWDKVIDSLQGTAHLGRSRTAQFGRVSVTSCLQHHEAINQSIGQGILTLWLLSDLYLQDQGQTTLLPTPELMGLPTGTTPLIKQSFIRSRRYSAYNAFRKHYDKERQVIARGSVLRYQLPDSFNDFDNLQKKLIEGLGLSVEIGLGQVAVNPIMLQHKHPHWSSKKKSTSLSDAIKVFQPKSRLIEALLYKQNLVAFGSEPVRIALNIFAGLCDRVGYARKYHAIAQGMAFDLGRVPSRTQFGRFKEVANQYRNSPLELWQQLTNPTNGILTIKIVQDDDIPQRGRSYQRSGWELKFDVGADAHLGIWLKNQLNDYKHELYFSSILAELAVLGLSDQWEKCCAGTDDTKNESQQGAEA